MQSTLGLITLVLLLYTTMRKLSDDTDAFILTNLGSVYLCPELCQSAKKSFVHTMCNHLPNFIPPVHSGILAQISTITLLHFIKLNSAHPLSLTLLWMILTRFLYLYLPLTRLFLPFESFSKIYFLLSLALTLLRRMNLIWFLLFSRNVRLCWLLTSANVSAYVI